jgi:hypothetical protein
VRVRAFVPGVIDSLPFLKYDRDEPEKGRDYEMVAVQIFKLPPSLSTQRAKYLAGRSVKIAFARGKHLL